jgi:mannose-6-phosphate isomerase-like protein (cupin superfamily)
MQRLSDTSTRSTVVHLADALAKGTPPPGNLAVPVFTHGTLDVEMYTPRPHDPQTPHDRDEVYLVARGRATFVDTDGRHPVDPGAFVFVAAGQPHRFEDVSDRFRRLGALLRPRPRPVVMNPHRDAHPGQVFLAPVAIPLGMSAGTYVLVRWSRRGSGRSQP